MYRHKLRLTAALLLAACLTGCASSPNSKQDTTAKPQSYKNDGYLGVTSVNPNNPLNPTYHHYEDDANLMKAVLAQLKGIETTNISINGPVAKVKVKAQPQLSDAQVEELRSQVRMALETNMPRYRIKIKMEK